MSATLDARYRQQAGMITAGFAGLLLLLMFLLKWDFPSIQKLAQDPGIEVELNLPEDPPLPPSQADGGGGGGNPVQAAGPAGIAPETPPAKGDPEDSKDLEDDDKSDSPPITKPPVSKPEAKTITNKSIEKAEPKPIEVPAPPRPKAVLGKTTTGAGKGGGTVDDYDRAGGSGNGFGVGKGDGTGGGTGNGTGGGNGTGSGHGNGPKVTRGDRKIVRYYSFEGDLDKAVIYANVTVSPDGVGKFNSIAKGSSNSSNAYKEAIIQYLQNIKFDKADHESMLTVQFNFRVN